MSQMAPYSSHLDLWFDASAITGGVDGAELGTFELRRGGVATPAFGPGIGQRARYFTGNGRPYIRWPGNTITRFGVGPIEQKLPLNVFLASVCQKNTSFGVDWAAVLERSSNGVALYSQTGAVTVPMTIGTYWGSTYATAADEAGLPGVRSWSVDTSGLRTVRTPLAVGTSGPTLNTLATWTMLGCPDGTAQYPAGDWYELLLYQGIDLSASQITEITAYLQKKWGVA